MKVFCCGLPRTGTRSVLCGLQVFGLRVVHVKRMTNSTWNDGDAFADTPIYADWWRLDQQFPKAKFILTVRDPDAWFDSFSRVLGNMYKGIVRGHQRYHEEDIRCYTDVFQKAPLERKAMISAYTRHSAAVHKHFRGRKGKLLQVDVSTPGALAITSEFLGLRPKNFPNVNKISKVTI